MKGKFDLAKRFQNWIIDPSTAPDFTVTQIHKSDCFYIEIYLYIILNPHYFRGVDVENAIKIAAADDGFVTYDELRENLRK